MLQKLAKEVPKQREKEKIQTIPRVMKTGNAPAVMGVSKDHINLCAFAAGEKKISQSRKGAISKKDVFNLCVFVSSWQYFLPRRH
jgi:hypothetical protein